MMRQVVAAWNGMSISAFALAGRALQSETPPASPSFPVEGRDPAQYLQAAVRVTPHPPNPPQAHRAPSRVSDSSELFRFSYDLDDLIDSSGDLIGFFDNLVR